jgi:hypothetical protein
MRGVEGFVTFSGTKGRVEREVGSFQLERGGRYQLLVRETDASAHLIRLRPLVRVELHPWDVEKALGPMLIGLIGAVVFGAAGLIWLVGNFTSASGRWGGKV